MRDLETKAYRGGAFRLVGQVASIGLRLGSIVVLARLLEPGDFGLVAMVLAVTGIYELFTSAGLSMATTQRAQVSKEQNTTLFYINVLLGVFLALLCVASAPLLVALYGEPRLFWITAAMGIGLLFDCAGIQHVAMMHRELQYARLSLIEFAALAAGVGLAIVLATAGAGYWALVVMAIVPPTVITVCAWLYVGWLPGLPAWQPGTFELVKFGGTITLNTLVVHVAFSMDKLLLGRYWGAEVLGFYGRAKALINFGSSSLHSAVGPVVFVALSRMQDDTARKNAYFLKAYMLVNSVTIPATLLCAIHSEDLVAILLGQKWHEAAPIFRYLAPTVLVFGIITPFAWLLQSTGYQNHSLAMGFITAILLNGAYALGLPYGATGMALAVSIAMSIWMLPQIIWFVQITSLRTGNVLSSLGPPALSCAVAAALTVAVDALLPLDEYPLLSFLIGSTTMGVSYVALLSFLAGQASPYTEFIMGLRTYSQPGAVRLSSRRRVP
jgi:PST family polysaccharide transporter